MERKLSSSKNVNVIWLENAMLHFTKERQRERERLLFKCQKLDFKVLTNLCGAGCNSRVK